MNAGQHAAWNGDSGRRWADDPDRRDTVLAPVADVLLAAARLAPGDAVLDIGCGFRSPAMIAVSISRPATPWMSLITLESLRWASLN